MLSQTLQPGAPAMQASSGSPQEQHLRAQLELLEHHSTSHSPASADSTSRETRSRPSQSSSRPSNGYSDPSSPAHDGPRSLATDSAAEAYIHPDLRATLASSEDVDMMPIAPPSGHSPGSTTTAGSSGAPLAPAPSSQSPGDDMSGEGRKAKRELSQSKRAAQNRAAQRAFRQRKEGYIKKLEQQVRDFMEMEQSFKAMQTENYALREYVISLQSRLLDAQGELPQPPPNVNLSHPPAADGSPHAVPHSTNETPLEAVAQAVAGLAAQEQLGDRHHHYSDPSYKVEPGTDDTRTPDDINRQMHADDARAPSPES